MTTLTAAQQNGAVDAILTRLALLMAPGGASVIAVVDNGSPQTITTGFTQPDAVRPLVLTPSGTEANVTAVSSVITGYDGSGNIITETAPPFTVASLDSVQTVNSFSEITKIEQPEIGTGVTIHYTVADVPIFASTGRGAIMIWENVTPNLAQLPALRAWYAGTEHVMGANDFIVKGSVGERNGTTLDLALDIIMYQPDKDQHGNYLDLQARLTEIQEQIIFWLNDADDFPNRFTHAPTSTLAWGFTRGQIVTVTFGDVMKKFGGVNVLPPPWYTMTMKFKIDVYLIYPT